jgi:hypothetical protein
MLLVVMTQPPEQAERSKAVANGAEICARVSNYEERNFARHFVITRREATG